MSKYSDSSNSQTPKFIEFICDKSAQVLLNVNDIKEVYQEIESVALMVRKIGTLYEISLRIKPILTITTAKNSYTTHSIDITNTHLPVYVPANLCNLKQIMANENDFITNDKTYHHYFTTYEELLDHLDINKPEPTHFGSSPLEVTNELRKKVEKANFNHGSVTLSYSKGHLYYETLLNHTILQFQNKRFEI